MKKFLCCILIVVLAAMSVAALAEVPSLSESLFKYAKGALTCLASGAYDKVVTSLPFSDVSPSADEWRSFAKGSFHIRYHRPCLPAHGMTNGDHNLRELHGFLRRLHKGPVAVLHIQHDRIRPRRQFF